MDLLRRQQTTLARFGELALRSDDLDLVLTEACRLAAEALDTELAKVVELQADGLTLLVRAGVGWGPNVIGLATLIASDDTSEGHALLTGEPMISPDIATETRFTYAPFLVDNGVRAIANVLIIGGQGRPPFGILQVDSRRPRPFTDADTAFLRSYANLLAATVERIRINRELRKSNERLEARVAERTRALTAADVRLRGEALERERIEGDLRQAQKMEAVGQLTGGIAHDFNNLLTAIIGSVELIRSRVRQGRLGDLDRFVDAALTSSVRAAALSHRLLDFSRRQTSATRPTNANQLIEGLKDLFRQTIGSNIRLEFSLADDPWPILCDANQLENALLNLVINARHAMPDGGHVSIATENRSVIAAPDTSDAVPPGDYLVLTVADGGAGMTPEVLAQALDPFFTTKPAGLGTGLGLSMIKSFVTQAGGHVRLRSEPGQGVEVALYLPRHLGLIEHAVEVVDAVDPSAVGSAAVLVVEDDPSVRTVILDTLTELGYAAQGATDGEGALLILESGAPVDLLLTDIGLRGGMNGVDLATAARQRRPALNVLFVTGSAESAALAPKAETIEKPFKTDELAARVSALLGAERRTASIDRSTM